MDAFSSRSKGGLEKKRRLTEMMRGVSGGSPRETSGGAETIAAGPCANLVKTHDLLRRSPFKGNAFKASQHAQKRSALWRIKKRARRPVALLERIILSFR
jgi:hypothetical protein